MCHCDCSWGQPLTWMEVSGGAEGRICESPVGRRQTHRTVWSEDNGGEAMAYPETEHTGLGSRKRPRRLCLFFFTYLLSCGGRWERQQVDLGGLHWAGGCSSWGAEGRLDHVNGFSVAHLSEGLYQLSYCAPRDLQEKKMRKVCSWVKTSARNNQAGCKCSSARRRCFLHCENQVWKGQREERLKKIQCLWVKFRVSPRKLAHEITKEQFTVSTEWARERERYAQAVKI